MGWKYDNEALARDMLASSDHTTRPFPMLNGDMIFIAQVRTGERALLVEEFLEIVERLGLQPATYIVEVL